MAIEGVGEEIIWLVVILIIVALISLFWLSTATAPLDNFIWLVQMEIHPARRVLQVVQVDGEGAGILENQLTQRRIGPHSQQALEALIDRSNEETNDRNVAESNQSHSNAANNQQTSASITAESEEHRQSIVRRYIQSLENRSNGEENESSTAIESQRSSTNTSAEQTANNMDSNIQTDLTTSFGSSKSAFDFGQESRVKLKFLDDTQMIARTTLNSTVGQFKRRYFMEAILAGKIVRLIYRGQLLRDDTRSLISYGLHDECVVHCHISTTPYAQSSRQSNTSSEQSAESSFTEISTGTPADAIAAIVGAEAVPSASATGSESSEPSIRRNYSWFSPVRNRIWHGLIYIYNAVMGPDPNFRDQDSNHSLNAAADAAARGWMEQRNPIGNRIGQYIHIIFIVKFMMIWTFVFLYPQYTDRSSLLLLTVLSFFCTIMLLSIRHLENGVQMPAHT